MQLVNVSYSIMVYTKTKACMANFYVSQHNYTLTLRSIYKWLRHNYLYLVYIQVMCTYSPVESRRVRKTVTARVAAITLKPIAAVSDLAH